MSEPKAKTSYPWCPEDIKFYYEKFLEVTSKYGHIRDGEFVELLVESCLAEREMHDGMVAFLTQVKQLGLEIETDQEKISKDIERMSRLRFYRKMIHASGLGAWEDELMRLEIQKTMSPGGPQQMTIPVQPRKGPPK